eukprot:TRINITY_DN9253_c0_g1_i1.p1 TRINITY_DN9253_c0_g1~~TRINITY_DN9253_c0_g1_i1.p1  ORF type:complete len:114 (-),score=27.19 TRINITY_DN9253_c0_g1_i1:47-388(-)
MGCRGSSTINASDSELLELNMRSPVRCTVHAYALDTVQTLAGRAAMAMGLSMEDGALVGVTFCDHTVVDRTQTLEGLGMRQQAEFSLLGLDKGIQGIIRGLSLIHISEPTRPY